MSPSGRLTPMMKQYQDLKARHPDALLLFRLGDFYELFGEDALVASRELELVLTSRPVGKIDPARIAAGRPGADGVRVPMCGVPHHAVETYVARLIERGHKVCIAEQLEDPRKTRGLVRRGIVRVITPGTVVEASMLRERAANYLAAVAEGPDGCGLALADLSTGQFLTTQAEGSEAAGLIEDELARALPAEVLLPRPLAERRPAPSRDGRPPRVTGCDPAIFDPAAARRALLAHLGLASLEGVGCEGLALATAAAGAIVAYLHASEISGLAHLRLLQTYHLGETMMLDGPTRRNLELVQSLRDGRPEGSLLATLDRTLTAMGGRLLRQWLTQPLRDVRRIRARLDAVDELTADGFLRGDLREALDGLHDVERAAGRVAFGTANARDVVALGRSMRRLPRVRAILSAARAPRLADLGESLDPLDDVAGLIEQAVVPEPPIELREGGLIRPGYDGELDRLRAAAGEGRAWLVAFEERERRRTGIRNLRVRYNDVFGYFVEVTRSQLPLVPADYQRRQTVAGGERFTTPDLKEREALILAAEDRARELDYDLFTTVRARVAEEAPRILASARVLAELDVLASLAEVAAVRGYARPEVDEGDAIEITGGRHPMVEASLDGERFVPNDLRLDPDRRLVILTGPNMAGKSTLVRQVALITLLAQAGSFVPAAAARIGVVDRIFTRVGAADEIARGKSTFLVEMAETAHILHHATGRSLVILDEVGRGTSTYDGVSLAHAVAEHLHTRVRCKTLFATHFHELTRLGEALPAAANMAMAVHERDGEVIFLRRAVEGGSDRSYGIHVARLAGLPPEVIERARVLLAELERQREARGRPPGRVVRLPVLSERGVQVLRDLQALDLVNLTPLQALNLLHDLQQSARRQEEAREGEG